MPIARVLPARAVANGNNAPKYVNMADINRVLARRPEPFVESDPPVDLIELFFFAYRDFTSDPDAILAEYKFGRAHHRVLHFVDRNPGLRVADLLDMLKLTKQSLGRVLKELVEGGLIEQRTGATDRRQRHLHTTPAGHAFARRLAEPQARRIRAALADLGPTARRDISAFLFHMIDAAERPKAAQLTRRGRTE